MGGGALLAGVSRRGAEGAEEGEDGRRGTENVEHRTLNIEHRMKMNVEERSRGPSRPEGRLVTPKAMGDKAALRCIGADDTVEGALEGGLRPCVDAVLRGLLPGVVP